MNGKINGDKTSTTQDTLSKQKINFNLLLEQNDGNNIEINGSNNNVYFVSKYSPKSEEYTHIKKIIPLKITLMNKVLFTILNIITCGIINLIMKWFPSVKFYIRYNTANLLDASHLGIYGFDGELDIIKIKKINFPIVDLEKDSIITNLGINLRSMRNAIMFDYKSYDYIFNENTNHFEILDYGIKCPRNKILKNFSFGLYPNEVEFLKLIFGKCDIDIQITNIKKIILEELSDPFYLFELYSVILWFLTEYYFYSIVVIILTSISFLISVKETHSNLKKIEDLSKYSCPINIYRKNLEGRLIVQKLSSLELVPGDLFEVPDEGITLPCDCILLKGSAVVNESMLTGESIPIIKNSLENSEDIYDSKLIENNKYVLFSGTKILHKQIKDKNDKILAIVSHTGFRTFKGQMLSSVIFPEEEDEDFRNDSLRYIVFMIIVCFVGYFISLKYLVEEDVSAEELTLRFFELFTTAVPPSLPTCLSLGMSNSLQRLKKFNIFCINRERVTLLGTINTIVFDKTGTLTENYLDINGFIPTIINNKLNVFEFGNFSNDSKIYFNIIKEYLKIKKNNSSYVNKNKDLLKLYFECLTSCHCLSIINNKIIGDPIDVKMFQNTDWILEEKQNDEKNIKNKDEEIINNYEEGDDLNEVKILYTTKPKDNIDLDSYEIEIYKRFDFSSNLQRMSVIVKDINENYFKIFCKGSPEKIKKLCLTETIPIKFDETFNYYAAKGYRVLAMACQYITIKEMNIIETIQREKIENKMIFLGFLIVTDKLKPETKSTIISLDKADMRIMMATGDNILTSISVSKECDIVKKNQELFLLEYDKDENGKDYFFWDKYNDNKDEIDEDNIDSSETEINNDNHINDYNDLHDDKSLISIYPVKEITDLINSEQKLKEEKKVNEYDNLGANTSILTNITSSRSRRQSISINVEEGKKNQIMFINDFSPLKISKTDNYTIALTGETFNKLSELNRLYLLFKPKHLIEAHQVFRLVLKKGNVFARMNPQHKALLIESLKEEGLIPLMCGDGSNDCLALRKANVGVSLSIEEASISAHFTSLYPGINCLLHLLKEGKCSLAACIQVFKYVICESMIQFIAITLVMIYNSYFSDFQFFLGDVIISIPVVSFYLMIKPADELTYQYPVSGILTFPVLISVFSQMFFILFFQLGGNLFLKNIYKWENICGFVPGSDYPLSCEENTIFFIISNFQFIICSLAFCTFVPFRQNIFKNRSQVVYYFLMIIYMSWFTINCDEFSRSIFMLYDFDLNYTRYDNKTYNPKMFKYILFLIVVINFVISFFFERLLINFIEIIWNKNRIKQYKKEINKEKENYILKGNEYFGDVPLFKYHDVFYYDRRYENRSNKAKKSTKKKDGRNFIELVGANENSDNSDNSINSNNKNEK